MGRWWQNDRGPDADADAADNGFQEGMMAPTEILAQQHFNSIRLVLKDMPVCVKLLGSSRPGNQKR